MVVGAGVSTQPQLRVKGRQGVNLTAGKRMAGRERLPLGRPGDRPQGCGGPTGVPRNARTCEKPRRTRAGVRRSSESGGCQGKRTSVAASRAKRRWTEARSSNQVHRSAAAGERSLGGVPGSRRLKKPNVSPNEEQAGEGRQTSGQA